MRWVSINPVPHGHLGKWVSRISFSGRPLKKWMSTIASMAHNRLEGRMSMMASWFTKFLTDFP